LGIFRRRLTMWAMWPSRELCQTLFVWRGSRGPPARNRGLFSKKSFEKSETPAASLKQQFPTSPYNRFCPCFHPHY